jgi:hypothetical protein
MKPDSSNTPQTLPEATTSWADVARASSDVAKETLRATTPAPDALPCPEAEAFPGGDKLAPGDLVDHPSFGRCTVHRIVGELVHMAPENGRVVRLSQDIVSFTPAFMEAGRRVFSTSTQQ